MDCTKCNWMYFYLDVIVQVNCYEGGWKWENRIDTLRIQDERRRYVFGEEVGSGIRHRMVLLVITVEVL